MECCTYRQCSSVIWYTVDGMLHIQAMFVCYTLHSWWNVAHKGNIRLLYATQLMEYCTYMQCSSVICYTVDGMLHIQGMLVCLYATQLNGMLHIQAMFVCYMLHSWWNVAHTGNVRLLYATQLMECCTYRQCLAIIRLVDGILHTLEMFICYMLHSWWNVAHTGNVRLLYATQLMECCTYRQCSSVICYTVDTQECCTSRQCSSVICYTVDGMLHIQGMLVCYMLHSWSDVAHTGNVRLLYATQLMECCTYIRLLYATQLMQRCTSSVICYTVDGMLHIQEMFVCYMLHSWWNVAHTGNVRLLYATQLMECCT